MIFCKNPSSWQDLEEKTKSILKVCGYKTRKCKIKTARDSVNVDVLAINDEEKILCECKYWKKKVPKTIIHSFITVVSNYGANKGYIISKNGFQKGSYEATKNTNIKLLNWFEFQNLYERKWLNNNINYLYKESDLLFRYTDTFVPRKFTDHLSGKDKKLYWKYYREYGHLWRMIGSLHFPFSLKNYTEKDPIDEIKKEFKFPMRIGVPMKNKKITLFDFSELCLYIEKYQKEGINKFNKLTKLNLERQR